MKNNRPFIIAMAWCLAFLLALVPPFNIEAASYLNGLVYCAQTGLPIDSVRVTSFLYLANTRTDSAGLFALERSGYRAGEQGTIAARTYDEYRVSTGFGNKRFTVDTRTGEQTTLSLFDLHGRRLQKSSLQHDATHVSGGGVPAGVYIVNSGSRIAERILVTHSDRATAISRQQHTQWDVPRYESTVADTIYFCKDGYVSFAVPARMLETAKVISLQEKKWSACDFHNHTVLTDGGYIMDSVAFHAFGEGGLDVLVNSEHGGSSYSDTGGAPVSLAVPRWYSLIFHSWPKVLSLRKRYGGKIILQGLEWNCPGHEHASVGFIDDAIQPAAIAEFEYRFDFNDYDTGMPWLPKSNNYLHANAVAALEWLQRNHGTSSYFFINHPSREAIGPFYIEHFRDFHNAAPQVFLGLEGMPGHHKNPVRGSYARRFNEPRLRTWGGADYYLSKVGGLWDALLGEGRRLWIAVNSDFHSPAYDFWPGTYAKTHVAVTGADARSWLDGLKSGEMFIAHGDLISELDFTVDDGVKTASMGDDLSTGATDLNLTIRFKSPAVNIHGDRLKVDHVDLITGSITGLIDPLDPLYRLPVNETTKVVRRFTATDWTFENGCTVIRGTIPITGSTYFRLRGTSLTVGTPGEVDAEGNPLMDEDDTNTEVKAWNDLWFYSNPVFVYRSDNR